MDKEKIIIEITEGGNALIDNSIDVQRELDKAGYLVEDTLYNYFGKYSIRKEEDISNILFLFEKYRAYISLIEDSINKAKNKFDMLIDEQARENEDLIDNINEYNCIILGSTGICIGETEEYFVCKEDGKVVEWNLTNNNGGFILNELNNNRCTVTCIDDDCLGGGSCVLNANLENGDVHLLEIANVGKIPTDEEIKEFSKEK